MGKPFLRLRRKRFVSTQPGYESYLRMVNKPVGVIKDNFLAGELGGRFDDATMSQSQYQPEKLFEALKAYDRAYQWQPNTRLLSKAYNVVHSMFSRLDGTLIPMDWREVLHFANKTASAGAPYFMKKREVLESGYKFDPSRVGLDPCVAYFRTQSRRSDDGGFKPKVRLVWGFPLDTTVAEGRYARSAIQALSRIKTPYVLGLSRTHIAARLSAFQWAPLVGSFDWSKFDASVPPQLIRLAFKIVRGWFAEVEETEWNAIVKYFIHTPIVMPDGRVYFGKTGGIPSGSYFTGLIGSICNLLLIEYLTHEQGAGIRDILVMGDDSVVALSHALDLRRMGEVARLQFGMELHPDKQRYTRYDHDLEFLSHCWKKGRPTRPREVSRAKAVYPERGFNSKLPIHELRIERLLGLYADNPDFWIDVGEYMEREGVVHRYSPRTYSACVRSFVDKTKEVYGQRVIYAPLAVATYI